MSAKIITVMNQKGGVGKTTTACTLASGLSDKGYHVLTIDLDPQENLSYNYDVTDNADANIYLVLTGSMPITEAIQHTPLGDIVPAIPQMSILDNVLKDTGREYALKEAIMPILSDYDYVLIDTPPALNIITINALTASTYAIIVAQAGAYNLQGIGQFQATLESIKKYTNSDLIILGILMTRVKARANISQRYTDIMTQMADLIHTRLFKTHIREAVAIQEAADNKQSIFQYAPKSKVAEDYSQFVDEVLNYIK